MPATSARAQQTSSTPPTRSARPSVTRPALDPATPAGSVAGTLPAGDRVRKDPHAQERVPWRCARTLPGARRRPTSEDAHDRRRDHAGDPPRVGGARRCRVFPSPHEQRRPHDHLDVVLAARPAHRCGPRSLAAARCGRVCVRRATPGRHGRQRSLHRRSDEARRDGLLAPAHAARAHASRSGRRRGE